MYFILGFSHRGSFCTVRLYSHQKTSLGSKTLMTGPKSFHLDVCGGKCSLFCANFSGHGGWSSILLPAAASASCRLPSMTVCVCWWFCTVRGLNWGTGRSWHGGPRGPAPGRSEPAGRRRAEPPGSAPEGGMHLPRKLLLQLPQTLPGGLHVPQELGYLIVLGFAQLHALHRQACAEAAGEARVTPGSERQKASDGGTENRVNPGAPALPAQRPGSHEPPRPPLPAAPPRVPSGAVRCEGGGASGHAAPPGSAQPLRRAGVRGSGLVWPPWAPGISGGAGRRQPHAWGCALFGARKSLLPAAMVPARAEERRAAPPPAPAAAGRRGRSAGSRWVQGRLRWVAGAAV